MKPIEGYNKLRGGYYTPDKISEFIAEWAIRKTSDSVLEPSCGDGSFLSAITTRYRELGATDEQIRNNVLGIELDDIEAEKSAQYALVTDTLHKVRFLDDINGDKVAAAFLNTYTFALSETLGRSYGGGVLTFEPGEMRKIRIPMKMSEYLDLQKIAM